MSFSSEILSTFVYASKQAGATILELFDGKSSFDLKDPMQVLTEADLRSHTILKEILEKEFRGLSLIMEEQQNSEPLPRDYIVCDELDGTALFSRGIGEFGVILAHVEKGRPREGCIYFPASETFLTSSLGGGAFVNGSRILPKKTGTLELSVLSLEINNTFQDDDFAWINRVSKNVLATRALAATGAGFLELLQGKTDLFMNLSGAKVWDFAAGVLALEEAGGLALDKTGEPLVWDRIRMSAVMGRSPELVKELYRFRP
ncbi:inositol monophosphatase family protein [Leptospira wolffii]|uniref:inositol monophosphatase family protein n=1 Tax=Leptospira wolffii TaxID=409998 RepID=UPI001082565E|nr:inositol monophosphatase family protein [Leptospira wolffii]TGK62180.1 inositol monophosphatase family protein [Leptospira wolffii]TGK66551.1 inositol monophosphatase family protein [Leptospira wolffii]TGK74436.1 inositol monophosphatase family protein [Leptospira wolffii]TGL31989.1 inositol monophosphatase family protein [Leptospira wolffii]